MKKVPHENYLVILFLLVLSEKHAAILHASKLDVAEIMTLYTSSFFFIFNACVIFGVINQK